MEGTQTQPVVMHRRVLSTACGLALALFAAAVLAAPPAAPGRIAGAPAHAPGVQALGAHDHVEPAAQANQPAVQIVEPPESGMRADAFRVRVVLNPQLIDRGTYRSVSVQTYPLQPGPGAYSSYTVVGIDDVLKGLHVDVGNYRGPIRVYVSISARDAYTPGEPLFIAERVSKVSGPLAPVGVAAINAQNAQTASGSPANTPRPGPAPGPVPQAGQSPRFPLQPPASSFGSRP
jgi:hypothetical protein